MRISNPMRFNGDILATRKELLTWLGLQFANSDVQTGAKGTISSAFIPELSGLTYGDGKNLSAFLSALNGALEGKISDVATELTTVSGTLNSAITGAVADIEALAAVKKFQKGTPGDASADDTFFYDDASKTTQVKIDGDIFTISTPVETSVEDAIDEENPASVAAVTQYVSGVKAELNSAITGAVANINTVSSDLAGVSSYVAGGAGLTLIGSEPSEGDETLSGIAKVYTLKAANGTELGTINIPKDQFLKSVEFVAAAPDAAGEGNIGKPALKFEFYLADQSINTVFVNVSKLVDTYTGSNAINVEGYGISLKLNGKYLYQDANGLAISGVADAAAFEIVSSNLATVSSDLTTVSSTLNTNIGKVAADLVTVSGALNTNINTVSGELTKAISNATLNANKELSGAIIGIVNEKFESTSGYIDTEVAAVVTNLSTVSGTLNTEIEKAANAAATNLSTVSGALNTKIEEAANAAATNLSTVSGDLNTKIEAVGTNLSTVSGALNTEIEAVGTNLSTVSGALNTKIEEAANAAATNLSTLSGEVTTQLSALQDKVDNDIDVKLNKVKAKAITFEEAEFTLSKSVSSCEIPGRVLNIFDSTQTEVILTKVYNKNTEKTIISIDPDEISGEEKFTYIAARYITDVEETESEA
jgi:gas vesicle protein